MGVDFESSMLKLLEGMQVSTECSIPKIHRDYQAILANDSVRLQDLVYLPMR